jgi:hypothetical protein
MIAEQLRSRDIRSPRVLEAMGTVPRHLFVPEDLRAQAYFDHPLPIGYDQTISQPYIVAFMTQALDVLPEHKVLEIGTGSGYQAAILGTLAREVYTIEIIAPAGGQCHTHVGSARVHQRPRARRKRLCGLAGGGAIRPDHGHSSARGSAPGAHRPVEARRADGDPGRHGGARAPDHAAHFQWDADARDASGALCADDRKAEVRIRGPQP